MYELNFAKTFSHSYGKLIKDNGEFEKRTRKALRLLKNDPFYPSLKTHKVNTKSFGEKWSSFVTGDLRIIWDFDEKRKQIIILFVITKHSGGSKEYK